MFLSPRTDSRPFVAVLIALIAVAWLTLIVWGQSPYGRYLNHAALDEVTFSLNSAPVIGLFVGGWTLMTVAMMLPTALPLVLLFRNLVRARPNRLTLIVLLIAGYLVIWGLFGVGVHVIDRVIHIAVAQSASFGAQAWILGAATFLIAGVYQFTPLKYHCLDKCRSPFNFVMSHWHGKQESLHSFLLGIDHGIFCVGCCWSLMLLMFAVGVGNIGWMFVLASVMAIEKNLPWGRRLSAPIGVTLISLAVAVTIQATVF